MFFRVNGHFLSKTNGSGTKKSISSQKPTVLAQKSSFPLKNRWFLGKKVHFLTKTNGSGTKKFISSQKPTVLAQKSSFPLKNQWFWRKKREKRGGFSAFWEGGGMLSLKNIKYHSILKKFKSKKRRESDFFLFSYYKKWNLEMGE